MIAPPFCNDQKTVPREGVVSGIACYSCTAHFEMFVNDVSWLSWIALVGWNSTDLTHLRLFQSPHPRLPSAVCPHWNVAKYCVHTLASPPYLMIQLDEPVHVNHRWTDKCEERMLEESSPATLHPRSRSGTPGHHPQLEDHMQRPRAAAAAAAPFLQPEAADAAAPVPRQKGRGASGDCTRPTAVSGSTPPPHHPAHGRSLMQRASPAEAPRAEQTQIRDGGSTAAAAEGQGMEAGATAERKRLTIKTPPKIAA